MSSRFRDPQDQPPPTPNRSPSHRLEPPTPAQPVRRRVTTLQLPALDPETFHTRTTLTRIPAPGAAQEKPPEGDLWLIAGPDRPDGLGPDERPLQLSSRLRVQLMLLVLELLILLGAQGFIVNLSRDCSSAQADPNQPSCAGLRFFNALTSLQAIDAPETSAPTATSPNLPAIPADLPANVHSFVALALPYAVQAHQTLGWPISMLLAQWGLEHGWTVPDAQGYNWGNTTYAPQLPLSGVALLLCVHTSGRAARVYLYGAPELL